MIAGTPFAVILGLCATYLPLMILTIYSALEKVEKQYEEASLDLGLTPLVTFWKVILPLSSKGIVTGAIMVFLPCMSGFAIPEILGQGNVVLIGNVINDAFKNMNYNVGSLLAIVILIFILGAILIVNKVDKDGEGVI
jgi:spermidine/putrescine transport system permease protein